MSESSIEIAGLKVPLPGPKAKQAEALAQNIFWLVKTFGRDRIGFLTMTCGEKNPKTGKFVTVKERAEASRRFNSMATHALKRYRAGVVVTERHKDGGIHFHLVVVCAEEIRGRLSFQQCFPPKGANGKPVRTPDYRSANDAIKAEWAFWLANAKKYGFGRCEMQPVKKTGEAVGRYLGKYISKTWEHRREDDKGARLVRYFGNWMAKDWHSVKTGKLVKMPPPWNARHATMTPRSRAWRACCKQVELSTNGTINQDTVKKLCGQRWAWTLTKRFQHTFFATDQPWINEETAKGLLAHNQEVAEDFGKRREDGRNYVFNKPPEFWRDTYFRAVDVQANLGNLRVKHLYQKARLLKLAADEIEADQREWERLEKQAEEYLSA